jgi:hypothetical protein
VAVTPAPVRQVEFVLDRFTAADGRLTVEGRWYGVVGRRFLRPNLQIAGRRRLIAVLDHKPWAADDGAPWCAAFAYDGQEVGAALLQVAPDIAIELPPPGEELGDGRRRPRVALVEPVEEVVREETEIERLRDVIDRVRDERDEARGEADRLRAERDEARGDAERALRDVERAREEADQLRERERRAQATAEIFRRERDDARAAAARPNDGNVVIGALPDGERPPIFTMSRRRVFWGPRIAAGAGVIGALAAVVWIL